MRALPIVATAFLAALPAQDPTTPSPTTPRAPTEPDPAQQRLRADLQRLSLALRTTDHAYRGALTFRSNEPALDELQLRFVGACDRRGAWFSLDDWRVVTRADRSACSRDGAAWKLQDDEAPELPLSPRLLPTHLATATLSTPAPSEFEDRPALRVHARWTGAAAADVVRAAVVPSSKHEQVMDAIATMARKERPNVVVDGSLRYDPATARWLSMTLRFALLDGRVIEAAELRPAAPEGLPQLTSRPICEAIWTLQQAPVDALPRFALDAEAARALDLGPEAAEADQRRGAPTPGGEARGGEDRR